MGKIKLDIVCGILGFLLIFFGLYGLLSVPDDPACISAPVSPIVPLSTLALCIGILLIMVALICEWKETI